LEHKRNGKAKGKVQNSSEVLIFLT